MINLAVAVDLDPDVALLAPVGAPGVANYPVLHAVLDAPADCGDCVIRLAAVAVVDTTSVLGHHASLGLDRNRMRALLLEKFLSKALIKPVDVSNLDNGFGAIEFASSLDSNVGVIASRHYAANSLSIEEGP